MVVTRPCAVRDVSRNLFLLLSGEECCVVDPFMFWQCFMSRDFMTKSRDICKATPAPVGFLSPSWFRAAAAAVRVLSYGLNTEKE